MANISLVADTRRQPMVNGKQGAQMKLRVRLGRKDTTITLSVKVADVTKVDVGNMTEGPVLPGGIGSASIEKAANQMLRVTWARAMAVMYDMDMTKGMDGYTIDDLKVAVLAGIAPDRAEQVQSRRQEKQRRENGVLVQWREFLKLKKGRTLETYESTERRLREYVRKDGSRWWTDELQFEDMTKEWLDGLKRSIMKGQKGKVIEGGYGAKRVRTETNETTAHFYMKNVRAFCRWAYEERKTDYEVFRGYQIPQAGESEVRPITAREFGQMFTAKVPEKEQWIKQYMNMALLGFMLIGMNMVDVWKCKRLQYSKGYLQYIRSKTGKYYRIKVEPEAKLLLEKLMGNGKSEQDKLFAWAGRYENYKTYCQKLNSALKKIGDVEYQIVPGSYHSRIVKTWKPVVADMTYYRLRHTWATFAHWLGIDRETIKAALGHGKKEVTDVYIDSYQKPINEANRKVIDYAIKCMQGDERALSLGDDKDELPDDIRKLLMMESA